MNRLRNMFLGFLLVTLLALASADEEKYTSKYDDTDVDQILATPKLRNQYVNCFLEAGPCITADAKYFRDMLPEAFVTKCKKCTEKQVTFLDKATAWFTENEPETWERIVKQIYSRMKMEAADKE
ncbi:ejaculatory bulb-specific protein 3-like [Calliopsis andreniformis]|uniref:ejaculatory bulb-specific protein 3-like n=1 Tax=Calliopsis andreniformis TaxID=337506 RepID=UPI003FCDDC79